MTGSPSTSGVITIKARAEDATGRARSALTFDVTHGSTAPRHIAGRQAAGSSVGSARRVVATGEERAGQCSAGEERAAMRVGAKSAAF